MEDDLRDDLYEILGLEAGAEAKEVARAYKKRSLLHHPDRGGDVKKFLELKHARDVLLDPKKKEEYDKRLSRHAMEQKRKREREAEMDSKRRKMRDDLLRKESQVGNARQSRPVDDASRMSKLREQAKARQEELEAKRSRSRHQENEGMSRERERDRPLSLRTVTFKWDRSRYSHSDDSIHEALRSYGTIERIKLKTSSAKVVFASKNDATHAVRVEGHKSCWRSVSLQSHIVDHEEPVKTDERSSRTTIPSLPDGPISLEEHLSFERLVLERLRRHQAVATQ